MRQHQRRPSTTPSDSTGRNSRGNHCYRAGQAAHDTEGRQRAERLGGFSPQQLTQAMIWLAGYSPQAFDAALDAIEPCTSDGSDEPEPFCAQCGADIGIFIKFGLDWRHYKGATLSEVELFEPGHAPVVAWRVNAAMRV